MERLDDFGEYCRNLEEGEEKDSQNMVVRRFGVRGAMSLTRFEGLVVRPVLSCLGVGIEVGRVVRGYGSREG